MDLHGGNISVYSEGEGFGCTFTLELPAFIIAEKSVRNVIRMTRSSSPSLRMTSLHGANTSAAGRSDLVAQLINRVNTNMDRDSTYDFEFARESGHGSVLRPVSSKESFSNERVLVWRDEDGDGLALETATLSQIPEYNVTGLTASKVMSHLRQRLDDCSADTNNYQTLFPGLSFLVVDDAPLNRKMMCRLLRGRCEITEEAEDGKQALELVLNSMQRGRPFDAVLMDYQMPHMDGPTCAKLMRQSGFTGLIIGVTGSAMAVDIQTFVAHGADRVIVKPLNICELDGILEGNSKYKIYIYLTFVIF